MKQRRYSYIVIIVFNLMRSFTDKKKLPRPVVIRFTTNYHIIGSILESKANQKSMFDFKKRRISPNKGKGDRVDMDHSVHVD